MPAITLNGNTVVSGNGGVGLLLWSVGNSLTLSGSNSFTGSGTGDTGVYGWVGTAGVPMNVTLTSSVSLTGYRPAYT